MNAQPEFFGLSLFRWLGRRLPLALQGLQTRLQGSVWSGSRCGEGHRRERLNAGKDGQRIRQRMHQQRAIGGPLKPGAKVTGRPERLGLREGLLRRSRLIKNLGRSRGIGKILPLSAGQIKLTRVSLQVCWLKRSQNA